MSEIQTIIFGVSLTAQSVFSKEILLRGSAYELLVKQLEYFGTGTDDTIYILNSDLVRSGPLGYFKESRGNKSSALDIVHKFGPYSSGTYNFQITNIGNILQTPTGSLLLVLEFRYKNI